jgi:predicted lipid-binding transport protein (Tim44 family)
MAHSQLLVIIAVAIFAGVILFRLYTVLGRRTGNEREPGEGLRPVGGNTTPGGDNVVALPDRTGTRGDSVQAKPIDDVERGLTDIKLADRGFETEHFVAGAKKAHEMIVTAFATGDRAALKPLVSDEVYAAFDHAIKDREARHETVKFTVVGYKAVKITHAVLKGRTAEITLAFVSQVISSTSDTAGAIIEGDPANTRDVTDVWTFARDAGARDPNWTLVATSGGEV